MRQTDVLGESEAEEQENSVASAWKDDDDSREYIAWNPGGSVWYVVTREQIISEEDANEMDRKDMLKAINAWCKKKNFWPNLWRISDHGNVTLIDKKTGKVLGGLV